MVFFFLSKTMYVSNPTLSEAGYVFTEGWEDLIFLGVSTGTACYPVSIEEETAAGHAAERCFRCFKVFWVLFGFFLFV